MEHFVTREERYRVVREEEYEHHMVPPPQDDPLKIMLEQLGKRAEKKASVENHKQSTYCKRPHLHANTVVQQQPPDLMVHKVQTYTIPHHERHYQQPIAHKGPDYTRTGGIAHQGHAHQQPNMGNQVLPSKKHGGVMDCNEVAKLYGGVVLIDYGRNNKFPLRA